MTIKARFFVAEFNKQIVSGGLYQATVVMRAVRRETDDNIAWAKYTPSGTVTLSVSQEAGGAYEAFESLLGHDVSLTFEPIEE